MAEVLGPTVCVVYACIAVGLITGTDDSFKCKVIGICFAVAAIPLVVFMDVVIKVLGVLIVIAVILIFLYCLLGV